MKIPEDHNKINKNNQDKKSMTIPFILPIIIESLLEKILTCNNEKPFTPNIRK